MLNPNRRLFIQRSACALAGALAASCVPDRSVRKPALSPEPCLPSAWTKQGLILEPTEPWEEGNIQNFTTTAEPLGGGAWRIYYSVSGRSSGYGLAWAEGVPGEPMKKVRAVCSAGEPVDAPFSIGNLPEEWKPVQGVHLRLRNGAHRIYFWAHGPRIARYLAAESSDGRRYRVLDPLRPLLYHPSDRAAFGVPSPDGVTLNFKPVTPPAAEPAAESRMISNDATNIYILPDGSFEVYSVGLLRVPATDPAYIAKDNAPGLLRVVDRYTSGDGLRIDSRERVIQRDAADPADQQFYYLSVTRTGKGCVGMLGHYRCEAQTMDLEWCFSPDGRRWERPLRQAWLPRGNPPAPDCFGTYANHGLVRHRGLWHLFYTGVNSAHNDEKSYGKPRQVVMLATTPSIWRG